MARLRIQSRRTTAMATAVLLGLVTVASAATANRTCYFPDGSVSASDFPCSDAETIHCCNSQSACLSTGYCMSAEQPPYVISRGSCTDNAWGTGCPAKCSGTDDDPSGGMPISWLGTTNNAGSPLYCCGPLVIDNGSIACANSEDAFVLGASELLFGAAILANTTTTNGTAATTSKPASSATSSSSSASQSSGSSSGDSDDDSDDSSSKSSSNVTAVGAGVGVSLGVVAAAFAAWGLWERRKRQQQLQAFMNGTLPPGMVMAHQGGYPDNSGPGSIHPGNTGTPFSPGATTTGTLTSTSPSAGIGGGGVYAASNNGTKPYADSQQPLVELSAYPRQFEELPSHNE